LGLSRDAIVPPPLPAAVAAPRPIMRILRGPEDRPHRPRILLLMSGAPPALLQDLANLARAHHWQLITDSLHTGVMPTRWSGDGILAFAHHGGPDTVTWAHELEPPCVTITVHHGSETLPRIEPDGFAIGRLAAKHLLERN